MPYSIHLAPDAYIVELDGHELAEFSTLAKAGDFVRRAKVLDTGAYWFKFLIAIDMFAAALLFRDPDVTISSMTGLALRGASPPMWASVLGGVLNWLATDHCELAIVNDIRRARSALQLMGL